MTTRHHKIKGRCKRTAPGRRKEAAGADARKPKARRPCPQLDAGVIDPVTLKAMREIVERHGAGLLDAKMTEFALRIGVEAAASVTENLPETDDTGA